VTLSGPGTVPEPAYRVVQEAVSNAVRHAPGSAVHVEVSTSPSGRTAVRVASGLDGLRDRVTSAGGTFWAGVTPDGRFVVEADVPGLARRSAVGRDCGGSPHGTR
jgi:signal transduction histidine kinase